MRGIEARRESFAGWDAAGNVAPARGDVRCGASAVGGHRENRDADNAPVKVELMAISSATD